MLMYKREWSDTLTEKADSTGKKAGPLHSLSGICQTEHKWNAIQYGNFNIINIHGDIK